MGTNAGVQTKLVVVLLITLFASSAFAQGASDPTNEQHRGNVTWGAWQRQHKPSPQATLGVTVGNRTAIQFVRRW
jgi:hypothetical protein